MVQYMAMWMVGRRLQKMDLEKQAVRDKDPPFVPPTIDYEVSGVRTESTIEKLERQESFGPSSSSWLAVLWR